jgi:hypothetical protein
MPACGLKSSNDAQARSVRLCAARALGPGVPTLFAKAFCDGLLMVQVTPPAAMRARAKRTYAAGSVAQPFATLGDLNHVLGMAPAIYARLSLSL